MDRVTDFITDELLHAWEEGAREFNLGRYWHAHEFWEKGWRQLPPAPRLYVQALIQGAAVFHLLEKGRSRPALALSRSAVEKLRILSPRQRGFVPRVEIPGLFDYLESLPERWMSSPGGLDWKSEASSFRARLIRS